MISNLPQLLDIYPRVKVSDPAKQDALFSVLDQTGISSDALQISFERKPDFYRFLKAQGDHAIVYNFLNKDNVVHGCATSTFRKMNWNGHQICIGYTGDLRTTHKLDREARLQWRNFYGHAVDSSQNIEEFHGCIGFITAVWNENKLAQKSLVNKGSQKKRPGDFTYNVVNTYQSYSLWGRSRILSKPKSTVRPIKLSEDELLLKTLCNHEALSWTANDLERTLAVFQKDIQDFYVLEEKGAVSAFVLPVSTSEVKKTIIKKWPFYLQMMSKLLPLFGKKKITLNSPLEVLQLVLFKSLNGDEDGNLLKFVNYFWYENNQRPQCDQFNILSIGRWDKPNKNPLPLKSQGYLFTSIEGALYKVITDKTSPLFKQINDFSHLEVGFL